MDVSMLNLLSETTGLMESLGFLWVVQTGLEVNLWPELETAAGLAEIMERHPEWDEIILDHFLEQAVYLDLLTKKDGQYQVTKLAKAINKYRDYGLEALYKELAGHWTSGFRELPGLLTGQKEKLMFANDLEDELIAKASQASEPFVWPFLRAKGRKEHWRNVLDLGCGEGRYLARLADEFPELRGVGLELNPAVASRAQERTKEYGERIQILCHDIMSLLEQPDEPDEQAAKAELDKFDLCLLNNSIYYFSQEQRRELLGGIKRLLAPGGQVGILTATRKGDPVRIFRTHLPQNLMSFFLACHQGFTGLPSKQEMLSLLEETGYSEVEVAVMPLGTSHYFFANRPDD